MDLTVVGLVTLAAWLGLRRAGVGRARMAFRVRCDVRIRVLRKLSRAAGCCAHAARGAAFAALRGPSGGRSIGWTSDGNSGGGAPFLLAQWPEVYRQVSDTAAFGQPIPPRFALSPAALLWQHVDNLVRFGIGPVAALRC